jgi:flagellar hook capping protein FlgD
MRRSAAALLSFVLAFGVQLGGAAASTFVSTKAAEPLPVSVVRNQAPVGDPTTGAPSRAGRFLRSATVGDTIWQFMDSLETESSPSNEGGWTHYDASGKITAWHIDTFLGCQGHSWWCGRIDSTWVFDNNRAGYENDWKQYLTNSFPTANIPTGTHATLSFRHYFNAEPNYDYGTVEVNDPDQAWVPIATFTGRVPASGPCDTFTVVIPDSIVAKYRTGFPQDSIPGPLPVPFRFNFTSDIAYSSQDGLYQGDGWVIDNVTVKAGTNVVFFDDMESGMGTWQRTVEPAVGDYYRLQRNVLTEDECHTNQSNVWTDWNQIFQSLVPRLDNYVVTKPVAVNRSGSVFLAFDVYRNLPINSCFYYHANFRAKNVGDANWGLWTDPTAFVYYGGSKDWARQTIALPGAAGKDSVQVELGLKDYSNIFCDGVSTSANTYALFDNIAIGITGQTGPSFVVPDNTGTNNIPLPGVDLFNDTFQTTPFFRDDNFNSPLGDSAVVQVSASRGYKQGSMFYRFNGGAFNSTALQRCAPALPTFFFADVPPGSYPANTTMEYYFSATDSANATAVFPVDAITNSHYLSASVLPVKTATNIPLGCTDSLASILFVNHNAGREPVPYIAQTLTSLGYKFDTWDVNGPTSGVGNCIGGSDPADNLYHWPATDVSKLLQYSTIIWNSGDLQAFTITPQDEAVIQSWIQQPGKNRNLWIGGDDVGAELMANGGALNYGNFVGFTCGVLWLRTIWENAPKDTVEPLVRGVNGGPAAGRFMHLNGGCPILNDFDLLTLSSTANTGKAGLLLTYPNTFAASTRYATDYNTFSSTDSARVVFDGFGFNAIEEGGERLNFTNAIVKNYFKEANCYVATGVDEGSGSNAPPAGNTLRQNAPNPFNPETAIRYSIASTGPVAIRIYNVNGALVRTLVNRVQTAGEHLERWNGTDDHGRPLSSGAYFYRLETAGFLSTKKLILLR